MVGGELALVFRGEIEIGQLVVEHEAFGHQAGTERLFHRGRPSGDVAGAVGHGEIGGASHLIVGRVHPRGRRAGRHPGFGLGHAVTRIDQGGTRAKISRIGQALGRHRHEARIANPFFAVGIGEALALAEQVPGNRVILAQPLHVEAFQLLEHGQHAGAAGGWRAHAADLVLAVGSAHRIAHFGLIGSEIRQGQRGRVGVGGAHRLHDAGGNRALVERVRALGCDQPKRGGELVVAEGGAGFQRGAVLVVIERAAFRPGLFQAVLPKGDEARHCRRDGEAFGQLDCGFKERGPGQLAPFLVGFGSERDVARHAHAAPAGGGLHERHRLAIGPQELARAGHAGRLLAAIDAAHRAVRRLIDDEAAAADAGALRLHNGKRQHGGNGRIGGAATALQDAQPGFAGQRVRGGHHSLERAGASTAGGLYGPAVCILRDGLGHGRSGEEGSGDKECGFHGTGTLG